MARCHGPAGRAARRTGRDTGLHAARRLLKLRAAVAMELGRECLEETGIEYSTFVFISVIDDMEAIAGGDVPLDGDTAQLAAIRVAYDGLTLELENIAIYASIMNSLADGQSVEYQH